MAPETNRISGAVATSLIVIAVPGLDSWRQWVWEWDATPGGHVLEARATDKTGYTQTSAQAQPEPNGASGYPNLSVTVS